MKNNHCILEVQYTSCQRSQDSSPVKSRLLALQLLPKELPVVSATPKTYEPDPNIDQLNAHRKRSRTVQ